MACSDVCSVCELYSACQVVSSAGAEAVLSPDTEAVEAADR